MKIVSNFFENFKWTTLNFEGSLKMKEPPTNIFKRTLDIGFEWDWSVGLSTMLGDGHIEN